MALELIFSIVNYVQFMLLQCLSVSVIRIIINVNIKMKNAYLNHSLYNMYFQNMN